MAVQTKTANEGRCAYKTVVEHDLEKRANENPFVTFKDGARCCKCPETNEYAKQINCDAYHEERRR